MKILILGPGWRNNEILEFLKSRGHSGELTEDPISLDFLTAHGFELILSSGYAYKVPADVVERYFGKIINLHATYLPWGKGIGTTLFSLLEGTPKGVSLHLIDKEFDTGDIIAQERIDYSAFDTLRTLYRELLVRTTALFYKNFEAIIQNSFTRRPQREVEVKVHYHSRVDSEHFMDLLPACWDTPVVQVEELGAELAISEDFWLTVESEIE